MRLLRPLLRYLRFRPFDVSTPAGRDAERYRLAALAVATNVVSKAANLLLIALSIKLTIPYLGQERFGVWATFASLAAMLALMDLGVGNAIVNRVAHAAADPDPQRLRQAVTGGTGVLAILGLVSVVILLVAAWLLPWRKLFRLTDDAVAVEALHAAVAFSLVFGANLVSTGLLKALAGQQRQFEANLIGAGLAVLACIALLAASSAQLGVPWLIVSTFGVQSMAGLPVIGLLHRRQVLSFARIAHSTRREWPDLIRSGTLYFVLQVGTMVGWGSDSLILASLLGAGHVAIYAVAQRLFQFASLPAMMLNSPLWAAYADASSREDHRFVARTLRTSFLTSLSLTSFLSIAVLACSSLLIPWWTEEVVAVPMAVLAGFAVWTVIEAGGNAFAMYLNGCGIVRPQVTVVLAFCLVALPLKLILASQFGVAGLLCATIGAYLLVVVGLYSTLYRHDVLQPCKATRQTSAQSARE